MARHDQALKKEKAAALKRAIEEAGGPGEVARYMTENFDPITVQGVMDWKVCPPMRARALASAVKARGGKTTVRDLCPEFVREFARVA